MKGDGVVGRWFKRFALLSSEEEGEEEGGLNGGRNNNYNTNTTNNIEMRNFGLKNSDLHSPIYYRRAGWRQKLKPNQEQTTILILLAILMVVVIIASEFRLGRIVLYPFAIISTVFHEFGHAAMAWLTGGKMGSIEINMDESGATRFSGGWTCAILPAGYIGSTFIGALLLFMAFGRRTARYTAIGVIVILAITLIFAHSLFTILSSIGLLALLGLAFMYKDGIFCRHFILFLGATASLQSLLSILNTTVFHTIEGSDAYVFARSCSFLIPAFIYGIIWFIISIGLQLASIGSALVFFK